LLECTLLDLATSTRFTQRTLWSPRSTLFPYTTLFRSLFLLLRHGAAHQVRLAERIAEQLRADLHDLLLVDDDAVRLFQDRLELGDRKSTRLNSSHVKISYAVLCLKKKNTRKRMIERNT